MMKTKAITLQISRPCTQDWSAMEKRNGQQFCSSCQTPVIDFSNYSDAEIVKALSKSTATMCGRLTNKQLSRLNYYPMPASNIVWRKYAEALAVGTLFFMASCENPRSYSPAQTVPKVYGYLMDNNEKPLSGIRVGILHTDLNAVTDAHGRYEIQAKGKFDPRYHQLVLETDQYNETLALDYFKEQQDTLKAREIEYMVAGEIEISHIK